MDTIASWWDVHPFGFSFIQLCSYWNEYISALVHGDKVIIFFVYSTEARAYYIFACCSFFLLGEPAIVVKPTTNTNSHKYSSWKDVSSLLRVSVPLLSTRKRIDLSAIAQVWLRLNQNEQVFFTQRSSATFHMSAFLMTTRPLQGTRCGCSFTSCPGHIPATVLHPAHDLQTSEEQTVSLEGKKVGMCVCSPPWYVPKRASKRWGIACFWLLAWLINFVWSVNDWLSAGPSL
jgi:hypothetical protein